MRARICVIYKCISMRLQLHMALYSALGNAWAHANCMRWRIQIVLLGMNWHTQFTSYDNQAQVAGSHFHPEFICEVTQISNRITLALFGRLGHEEVRSF